MKNVKCEICGKEVYIEKLNVSFYTKWKELEPEKWICRECEEKVVWSNVIQYKLPDSYRKQ
ncbi:MAG: hypothetical protein ACTSR3_04015 [Candidatus Helarchaeota archaeon]